MEETERRFFEKEYLQLYEPLYRFLYQLCRDAQAAEDLVQETFTEFFCRISMMKSHPNPEGWIYVTARNKAMNYLRLKYHKDQMDGEEIIPEDYGGNKTAAAEDTVLNEFFQFSQMEGILSREEMELLLLRFDRGYGVKEIAERLHISEGACKMRFSRIFAKLKKHPELFRIGSMLLLAALYHPVSLIL